MPDRGSRGSRGFSPARGAAVAGAMAVVCGGMALLSPADSEAGLSKDQRRQIMVRSVFLLALEDQGGELTPVSRGSGTILTPDGAILTNHHVVWNDKKNKPYEAVIVGVTEKFDQKPVYRCLTFPKNAVLREELDLALIKCEKDMSGQPWRSLNWPVAEIGSSEELVPGDEVIIIGYPGIGGWTINYTTGKVSGFMSSDGQAGRFWIKTDADIASGNSGGSALDEDGRLIGVPSAVQFGNNTAQGRVGLVRPIELGRDLIDMALGGWSPGGGEQRPNNNGGFGGRQDPPPPQAQPGGVTLTSTVLAADDNAPIASALVIVLKPGVKVKEINKDNIGQKYLTKAITNAQGQFIAEGPIPRGQKFAVIVLADGYEPLAEDGVLSTEGSVPDRYDPWGNVKLRRE